MSSVLRSRLGLALLGAALAIGLVLRFAHGDGEAVAAAHSTAQRPARRAVARPKLSSLPSAEQLQQMLAAPPAQAAEALTPEERQAREQIALPVEQQSAEVQRAVYGAQLQSAPGTLHELARALDETRAKLGPEAEASLALARELSVYRARIDELERKLAALP